MTRKVNIFSRAGWELGDEVDIHSVTGEVFKGRVTRDYEQDPDPRCVDSRGNNARNYYEVELEDK